jgi:hypothetical protein
MAITTAAEVKKFVLKAYKLEADARADNNALLMNSPDALAGSIVDNLSQATGYGFWAFQRYWYRIESNEAVSEFHIDWDDGEDNSDKKANVSIIKNDKPAFFGITSHIYTQSIKFYPLIRVKSQEGFLSKWYTAHAGSGSLALNTFKGLDDSIKTTANSGAVYDSGQNSFSVVSVTGGGTQLADVAATGTVRFTNSAAADLDDSTVTVESTDGTTVVYTLDENRSSNSYEGSITYIGIQGTFGHPSKAAELFTAAVNHASNAHADKITASEGSSATVTLTQDTAGVAGNNTIATNDASDITVAGFTGGVTYTPGGQPARIPVFEPANVPPVGVLKVDRKRVFSGIDNVWLGNNNRIINAASAELSNTKTVHAYCSNTSRVGAQVKVTYQEGRIGGVSAISEVWTTQYGSYNESGVKGFNVADLEDKVIYIKTMDITYGFYYVWSTANASAPGTEIVGAAITPVSISSAQSTGALNYVTAQNLADRLAGVMEDLTYHGRDEFTSVSAVTSSGASGVYRYTVTSTHTNKGVIPAIYLGTVGTSDKLFEALDGAPMPSYHAPRFTTDGVDPSDGTIKQKTLTTIGGLTNEGLIIENVAKVLRAELVNNLEATDSYGGSTDTSKLYPGERIYLQASLYDGVNANLPPTSTMRMNNLNLNSTICSVSLGNPIVEENSIGTSILADVTESKVRCSNKSISYYYIDDNKLVSGDTAGHTANHQGADATYNVTDKLVNGADFRSTAGTMDLVYAFEWWREHQDGNYRYYPAKRLIRAQIEDNHTQVADDGFNTSPIVHWDSSSYLTVGSAAALSDGQTSEVSKWNYGVFLFTNKAKIRTPNWYDLNVTNRGDRTTIFGSSSTETHTLNNSTIFDTDATAAHYAPDNVSFSDLSEPTDGDTIGPRNALFMARKEKFDRIFVRVAHDRLNAAGLSTPNIANDITVGSTVGWPKIRIQVLYASKKTRTSSTIVWKPLLVIDKTKLKGKDDSSFYRSGEIIFNPPADWEKTSHSADIEYPYEDNFFDDYSNGTDGIDDKWTKSSYALIFLITQIDSAAGSGPETLKPIFKIMSMYPYNNSHSQLIEIIDPMHVSLNNYAIAQSVSFVRKGSYQEIKDRSGISQMRRIGAEGGGIKLGGVDLKGDTETTRAKFHEFQRDAVPLYYDVIHRDSSTTRLFGVMTDMSEDHPTGKVIPKFACSIRVTHILELDSSGNITDNGYIPLGGDVIDVGQYLSAS